MDLAPDFDEFIGCLIAHGVDFVIVGAYALAHHGAPRFTGDLDVLIQPTVENAERLLDALRTFGFPVSDLTPAAIADRRKLLEMGFRDVRNQGVLLRGVNGTAESILERAFTLLDKAKIMPYYFYMCDMIPNSEHWRVSVAEAQKLQHDIMGYLPGFATARIVCDVPFVGKRWVHQVKEYDRERGITFWTKNYRTGLEVADSEALNRLYEYYDPIYTLPESGQDWWRSQPVQTLTH